MRQEINVNSMSARRNRRRGGGELTGINFACRRVFNSEEEDIRTLRWWWIKRWLWLIVGRREAVGMTIEIHDSFCLRMAHMTRIIFSLDKCRGYIYIVDPLSILRIEDVDYISWCKKYQYQYLWSWDINI